MSDSSFPSPLQCILNDSVTGNPPGADPRAAVFQPVAPPVRPGGAVPLCGGAGTGLSLRMCGVYVYGGEELWMGTRFRYVCINRPTANIEVTNGYNTERLL